jgi:hypothetical protein
MSSSKKYSIKTSEKDNQWSAQIVRRVSARRTHVSKTKSGFKTETEALAWAETQLEDFMKSQAERNTRRDKKRS